MLNSRINGGSGSARSLVAYLLSSLWWAMVGHISTIDKNECVSSLSAVIAYYKYLPPIAKDCYLGELLAMGLKEEDDPYSHTAVSCHS